MCCLFVCLFVCVCDNTEDKTMAEAIAAKAFPVAVGGATIFRFIGEVPVNEYTQFSVIRDQLGDMSQLRRKLPSR